MTLRHQQAQLRSSPMEDMRPVMRRMNSQATPGLQQIWSMATSCLNANPPASAYTALITSTGTNAQLPLRSPRALWDMRFQPKTLLKTCTSPKRQLRSADSATSTSTTSSMENTSELRTLTIFPCTKKTTGAICLRTTKGRVTSFGCFIRQCQISMISTTPIGVVSYRQTASLAKSKILLLHLLHGALVIRSHLLQDNLVAYLLLWNRVMNHHLLLHHHLKHSEMMGQLSQPSPSLSSVTNLQHALTLVKSCKSSSPTSGSSFHGSDE